MARGGVALQGNSSCVIHNCTFHANSAQKSGGAGFFQILSFAAVFDSLLVGNLALSGAGFEFQQSSTGTFVDVGFTSNVAQIYGGAVTAYTSSSLMFDHCTFVGNMVELVAGAGGCVYVDGYSSSICSNSLLVNNSVTGARGTGGAWAAITGSNITFVAAEMSSNATASLGGFFSLTHYLFSIQTFFFVFVFRCHLSSVLFLLSDHLLPASVKQCLFQWWSSLCF